MVVKGRGGKKDLRKKRGYGLEESRVPVTSLDGGRSVVTLELWAGSKVGLWQVVNA